MNDVQQMRPSQGSARRGYLVVPRNRAGMIELMLGEDVPDELAASLGASDQGNLEYFAFTAEEVAASAPLLAEFERAFGFDSRGTTVEQLIDTRGAPTALDIATAYRTRLAADGAKGAGAASDAGRSAAAKMAQALEAALAYGSFVEFDFDLDAADPTVQ